MIYICENCKINFNNRKSLSSHLNKGKCRFFYIKKYKEPIFILDPDYGIACCEKCHYKYGHKTGTECSTGNLANVICKGKIL
jgi:hypothetical protein